MERICHLMCSQIFFLYSWVRASWINVHNCPTRCDYIQFYYISADSSTFFGWYPHPSSGAHSNYNYNIWHWSNRIFYRPLTWRSRMRLLSETCRAVCRNIIKLYIVATCWTIIDINPSSIVRNWVILGNTSKYIVFLRIVFCNNFCFKQFAL